MLIDLYGVLSHEGEVKRLAAPIEAESFVSNVGVCICKETGY